MGGAERTASYFPDNSSYFLRPGGSAATCDWVEVRSFLGSRASVVSILEFFFFFCPVGAGRPIDRPRGGHLATFLTTTTTTRRCPQRCVHKLCANEQTNFLEKSKGLFCNTRQNRKCNLTHLLLSGFRLFFRLVLYQ